MPNGSPIDFNPAGSRPSFVPPAFQRELRELTRYRTRLVEERSRIINRLQKRL
jgi:transposase